MRLTLAKTAEMVAHGTGFVKAIVALSRFSLASWIRRATLALLALVERRELQLATCCAYKRASTIDRVS